MLSCQLKNTYILRIFYKNYIEIADMNLLSKRRILLFFCLLGALVRTIPFYR